MSAHPIAIAGGGLAGLALGIGLRTAGVPVTIREAGHYPRHKVCGECLTGVPARLVDALGLTAVWASVPQYREVAWLQGGRPFRRDRLPVSAAAVSRWRLDAALAERFVALGGTLVTDTRVTAEAAPGQVDATGRTRAGASPWLGLKVHVRGLTTGADLEMHLGTGGYVGVGAVDDGATVNICGLFRKRPGLKTTRATALRQYLEACGLEALAARLATAEIDPASVQATAGFGMASRVAPAEGGGICLGDRAGMIPPFTGHGMALALQSGWRAVAPLVAWARDEQSWEAACADVRQAQQALADRPLRWAGRLHPFLLHPLGRGLFRTLGAVGLVPFAPMYKLTHS